MIEIEVSVKTGLGLTLDPASLFAQNKTKIMSTRMNN